MKPSQPVYPVPDAAQTDGISARDYIAIEAMKALITGLIAQKEPEDEADWNFKSVSESAYLYADAMILESNRGD